MHGRVVVVVVVSIVLLGIFPLHSQSPTATVNGQVRDTSGAVVQGADVQLINDRTNVSFPSKTNKEGIYSVTGLPPGTYRIQVSKAGFKTIVKPDIVLNVLDARAINFDLPVGAISQTVTVEGGAPLIDTQSSSVSTVVDRQFAENLPLNGRSFQTLIQLTPGVVLTTSSAFSDGQFSINGQRASSNYWMVDGVSANIGMSSTPGASDTLSGSIGGFSAQGGTNSLVSVDAMQEFRIETSTFAPEFGRTPGGQISIVTRSGTNQFHGTAFDYLRNDLLDANDWFADSLGLAKAEERQNDFGGTLGGAIVKNRTFFFFSYEGLRLRLPEAGNTTVPDLAARQGPNAVPAVQPFLNAYPRPNGPEVMDSTGTPTGTAVFDTGYSNRSTLDAASLRVDHKLNDKLTLFGRYNYAPSELVVRPGVLSSFALSVLNTIRVNTQTATVGATWVGSTSLTNDFRANYSHVSSSQTTSLDNFGGATPLDSSAVGLPSPYTAQNSAASLVILGLAAPVLDIGDGMRNLQRQLNFVDSVSLQKYGHALKFGVDYRRLTPRVAVASYGQSDLFFSLADIQAGTVDFTTIASSSPVPLILQNLGLFAQDSWRVRPRLTLTYGLRWDMDFTPKTSSGPSLPTVVNFNAASTLDYAAPGTAVFGTRYGNIAPRIGLAYQLGQREAWKSVVRGGWGIFYDLVTSQFQANPSAYPFGTEAFGGGGPFPLDPATDGAAPVVSKGGAVFAYDPKIKSPHSQEWNLAFEQSLGPAQSFLASYVGAVGRNLLVGEQFMSPNPSGTIALATLTGNYGTSDYHALQLQFQRRLSQGLQALASFSWAHSIDTGSTGAGGSSSSDFYSRQLGANANRGPSDFDIRRQASVALTYDIPAPRRHAFVNEIVQHWSVESIFQIRSAPPVDVNYFSLVPTLGGATVPIRPDVVPGVPFYLYGARYPGGKAFDSLAFATPPTTPPGCVVGTDFPCVFARQGTLGRNALRGFGAWQWDFAAHRDFPIGERVKLQFRAELFNILNHPNFGQPSGNLAGGTFGLSTAMLGKSLNSSNAGSGGFDPLYQFGGPRSVQFALKFTF